MKGNKKKGKSNVKNGVIRILVMIIAIAFFAYAAVLGIW